jgi:hypothetical protein
MLFKEKAFFIIWITSSIEDLFGLNGPLLRILRLSNNPKIAEKERQIGL